jgi:hypothetical protein
MASTVKSTVAGSRLILSGAISVPTLGILDCTNIAWVNVGGNWDSSAGIYLPGTNQVNMTSTGSTKLAAGQYFYNLWACNGGTTRTLLSNVVVQNRKIVDGTLTEGIYSVTINGTSTTPFTGNGTWSGVINITSTGASYTIWTNAAMTGTLQMQKNCTVIFTGGQLVITQGASPKWYNVTLKSWTAPNLYKWYAGSTNAAASLTFAASGLTNSKWYSVITDATRLSGVQASGGGILTFTHATWSGHMIILDIYPEFSTSASPLTIVQLSAYSYDAGCTEEGSGAVYALTESTGQLSVVAATGVVSGPIRLTTNLSVHLMVTDSVGAIIYQNWTVTVFVAISTTPTTSVIEDHAYSYDANTNRTGTWSIVTNASWASFAVPTGILSGTPDNGDVAIFSVSIRLSNTNGTAYQNYSLTVTNVAPVFSTTADTQAQYGFGYGYDANTDEDAWVTYSMVTSSNDLHIDVNGVVSGKILDLVNIWFNVTANDGKGGITWQNVTVQVSFGSSNPHVEITGVESGRFRVSFTYNLTDQPPECVLMVTWNFGDGQGSRDSKPVHTYGAPRDYLITISLWLVNGDIAYHQQQISVGDPLEGATVPEVVNWWASIYGMAAGAIIAGGLLLAVGYTAYQGKKRNRVKFVHLLLICIGVAMALYIVVFGQVF